MAKRAAKPADEKSGGGKEAKSAEEQKQRQRPTARRLVQRAYEKVEERLQGKENGKVIEDLAKLVKLEQELTGASKKVKNIKVQWEPSSSEK